LVDLGQRFLLAVHLADPRQALLHLAELELRPALLLASSRLCSVPLALLAFLPLAVLSFLPLAVVLAAPLPR
jgi:hypothetical protein